MLYARNLVLSRNILQVKAQSAVHSVEKRVIISHTVWKLENLSPRFFRKNFVKVTFLLNSGYY